MAINHFVPTVWSESLLQALDRTYVGVANCTREFEGDIREKGNTVRICGLGNVTIGDYTKNTNMSAPETLSDYNMELTIDQSKFFNFQIDDVDRAQASPKLMDAALKNAANALASAADSYVYSLIEEADNLVENDDVTPSNIIDSLIDARTILLKEVGVDPSDIVIEVAPEIAGMILKAKVLISTDNIEALEKGCIGSIGGCKIFVSSNLTFKHLENNARSFNCVARTRRAIAFAEQLSEIEAYRPELRFADAMKGLHLYGAKVLYPNEMVLLKLTCQP